jgi:hypothetical protein
MTRIVSKSYTHSSDVAMARMVGVGKRVGLA